MEKEKIIQGLTEIVGKDRVIQDEEVILESVKDYIGFRRHERLAGIYNVPRALCVVRVANTDQASKILAFLNANEIDVVPRTGGSSVTLGIEPIDGGVILDGSDMDQLIELSEYDMQVTVQCGMPLEKLENFLNQKGYTSGHFPQCLPLANIGGLIATRSIGQFSTLYGGIEELVVGLEAVMPTGEVVRIKNVPRRAAGPDLRHLFIGSEGALAFITEATLKIFPYLPDERWMHAYAVKGMKNGLDLIRDIMVKGYKPAVIRLHDQSEVEISFGGIAPSGYSLLLFLADGPKSITDATGKAIMEVVKDYDTIDLGTKPVESWLVTRNDVAYEMDSDKYYQLGLIADTCEVSANWSEIGEIYEAVVSRVSSEIPNTVFIGGHSSHSYINGTNIYFTFGFKVEDDHAAEEEYINLIEVIMEETLKRGGSISHHHGVGKYRTKWQPEEHGSSYPLLLAIKELMDPNGILNKGTLIAK